MANSFPSSGTVQLENGSVVSLCVQTTVSDNTTRDAITLYENSGQATGRQALSWYNGGQSYYKTRLWTQVGSGYNETTFGIDVADNSRTLDTRLVIQNGNVGIGTITPTTRLQVNGDASIISANNSSAGRSSYMRFANTADSTTAYFGLDGGGLVGNENGATLVGSSTGKSILFAPALTERMRVTSCGAMYMSRVASELTFADSVGGMYVRQNGNGTNTQEELRIFGRNISLVSHDGVRYVNITNCGNVGIGTFLPCAKLDTKGVGLFGSSAEYFAIGSYQDNFSGFYPVLSTSNHGDAAIGSNLRITGNKDLCVINNHPRMLGSAIVLGGNLNCLGTSTISFFSEGCGTATSGSVVPATCAKMLITPNYVGINTVTPSYRLHVNGTFYAAGSSQDYKQGVCQYDTDSCMFMKLKPVTYQYKEEYKHLGKELKSETQIGLIAEEVAETYPELAILVKENDNDVVRNVDYEKLSIVLLAEVQKLRKEVDDLKTK